MWTLKLREPKQFESLLTSSRLEFKLPVFIARTSQIRRLLLISQGRSYLVQTVQMKSLLKVRLCGFFCPVKMYNHRANLLHIELKHFSVATKQLVTNHKLLLSTSRRKEDISSLHLMSFLSIVLSGLLSFKTKYMNQTGPQHGISWRVSKQLPIYTTSRQSKSSCHILFLVFEFDFGLS